MADIFQGTQVPAWLQRETEQQPGQLGDVVGLAAGGLMNALQRDPNAPQDASFLESRKGVAEGLAEARLNIADPLWKLKVEQSKAAIMGRMAQAENAYAGAKQKVADTAAWMQDSQELTPWLSARPEDRQIMPAPAVRSKAGATLVERTQTQDSRYFIGKEANRVRDESSRVTLENQKRATEWDNAVGAADPTVTAQIAELPNQGWIVDGQGRRISPSTQALSILNSSRAAAGMLPFGAKQSEVKKPDAIAVEKEKQKGRLELQTEKEKAAAKSPKETAAIKNIEKINEWEQQAKEAEAAGDLQTAKDLRKNSSMVQEQLKGWGMTMGYDDQGRPIMTMGKGSQPTVATQTMAQGKLLQYENATQLMNWLSNNLTDSHVGVAGAAGEFLVDKTLEQVLPGVANKDRIKARTTLIGLRETLLREMSDDRTGRFSVADRNEIEKALPSSGMFESKTDAMERINRVREILADRGKVYARSMGVKPPTWTLSEDEIVKMYQDGQKSGLDPKSPEFKKQFLTKDEATDALVRFH